MYPTAEQRLILTLSGQMNGDVAETLLSNVRVSILPAVSSPSSGSGSAMVGITSADGLSSAMNVSGMNVSGSWGEASQPEFLNVNGAIALDYGNQEGVGVGDAIMLTFNQPVRNVRVNTKADVDAVFAFSPANWCDGYSGRWLDYNTLLITVDAVSLTASRSVEHRLSVAVGNLSVSVLESGDLRSYDGTSEASNATVVVGAGSWGDSVCDVRLEVYSHRAISMNFSSPATRRDKSAALSSYLVQVSTSPMFSSDTVVVDRAMTVADAESPVVSIGGSTADVAYYVRIAVPVWAMSIAGVTFPSALQPLYTTPGMWMHGL